MKRFSEHFKDQVDCYDGSVVLHEPEFKLIQSEAYRAGMLAAYNLVRGERNMQHPLKHAVWNSMCVDVAKTIRDAADGIPPILEC